MLLVRIKEKNVIVEMNNIQKNRLILKRKWSREKFDTVIMNVLFDEINGCLYKDYGNELIQFEFEVRDFRYLLHIVVKGTQYIGYLQKLNANKIKLEKAILNLTGV